MSSRRQGFRRRPSTVSSALEADANTYREERPLSLLHPELSIHDELPIFDASPRKHDNFYACKFPTGDLSVNLKPSQVPMFRFAAPSTSASFDPSNPYLLQIGYSPHDDDTPGTEYYRFIPINDELLDDRESKSAPFKGFNQFVRVEYDMDRCDFEHMRALNKKRTGNKSRKLRSISREAFEAAMTLLEIAWFSLEQRMPARKKSKITDEIPDSEDQKCVICDDGECDNNNAIVFCDGCDIGVHQDCYGVPFIPEGQWLCRACQASRKKKMTCAFCPNKSGAFKKTNTGEWVHMVCSIWIPETRITDPIFIEPVTGIDRIDKNRWKLVCYICKKRMGACIQCSSKKCPQAYHPTCGRKARLCMKMSAGIQGALLDQSTVVSYCDKHTPPAHKPKVDVRQTVRFAKEYYRKKQDLPKVEACEPPDPDTLHPWKTKGGIPVIPAYIAQRVEKALEKFRIQDCAAFVNETCRYWALKRENKKGAYLLKRLQNISTSEPDIDIDYQSAESKLLRLETMHKTLDILKQHAEQVRIVELSKLATAKHKEELVVNTVLPFTKSIQFIWEKIMEADMKLALKLKGNIRKISNSQAALGIDKKIQDCSYTSIAEFETDLFQFMSTPEYPYFTAKADKIRSVAISMIRKAELDTQSYSLDAFLPLSTRVEGPEPGKSPPETYDYEVNYHPTTRKRKRLLDDDV